jgi:hypothetical protein
MNTFLLIMQLIITPAVIVKELFSICIISLMIIGNLRGVLNDAGRRSTSISDISVVCAFVYFQ